MTAVGRPVPSHYCAAGKHNADSGDKIASGKGEQPYSKPNLKPSKHTRIATVMVINRPRSANEAQYEAGDSNHVDPQ